MILKKLQEYKEATLLRHGDIKIDKCYYATWFGSKRADCSDDLSIMYNKEYGIFLICSAHTQEFHRKNYKFYKLSEQDLFTLRIL